MSDVLLSLDTEADKYYEKKKIKRQYFWNNFMLVTVF